MTELANNSHKAQEEVEQSPQREKIAQGKVKVHHKGMRKAEEAFISEDVSTVKEYLVWDVFVPALKDVIVDMIKKAADAIFYGDRRSRSNNLERRNGTTYVRYDKPSYEEPRRRDYSRTPRYSSRFNFQDIVFESKQDAENILDELYECTMRYGMVSVNEFYELAGMQSVYTDYKYGWADLSRARVEQVRGGYVLYLPRPILLDEE